MAHQSLSIVYGSSFMVRALKKSLELSDYTDSQNDYTDFCPMLNGFNRCNLNFNHCNQRFLYFFRNLMVQSS